MGPRVRFILYDSKALAHYYAKESWSYGQVPMLKRINVRQVDLVDCYTRAWPCINSLEEPWFLPLEGTAGGMSRHSVITTNGTMTRARAHPPYDNKEWTGRNHIHDQDALRTRRPLTWRNHNDDDASKTGTWPWPRPRCNHDPTVALYPTVLAVQNCTATFRFANGPGKPDYGSNNPYLTPIYGGWATDQMIRPTWAVSADETIWWWTLTVWQPDSSK